MEYVNPSSTVGLLQSRFGDYYNTGYFRNWLARPQNWIVWCSLPARSDMYIHTRSHNNHQQEVQQQCTQNNRVYGQSRGGRKVREDNRRSPGAMVYCCVSLVCCVRCVLPLAETLRAVRQSRGRSPVIFYVGSVCLCCGVRRHRKMNGTEE